MLLGSGEYRGVMHSCPNRATPAETTHTGGTFIAREGSPARLKAVLAAALLATREASLHGAFRVASSRIGGGVARSTARTDQSATGCAASSPFCKHLHGSGVIVCWWRGSLNCFSQGIIQVRCVGLEVEFRAADGALSLQTRITGSASVPSFTCICTKTAAAVELGPEAVSAGSHHILLLKAVRNTDHPVHAS